MSDIKLSFLKEIIACAKMDSDVEPENTEVILEIAHQNGYNVIDDRSDEEKKEDVELMGNKIAGKAKTYLQKMDNGNTSPICPKCGSTNISQYRMPTGPIWCNYCEYRVEKKEEDHSFYQNKTNINKHNLLKGIHEL